MSEIKELGYEDSSFIYNLNLQTDLMSWHKKPDNHSLKEPSESTLKFVRREMMRWLESPTTPIKTSAITRDQLIEAVEKYFSKSAMTHADDKANIDDLTQYLLKELGL